MTFFFFFFYLHKVWMCAVVCCWLQAQYFICGCAIFIQSFLSDIVHMQIYRSYSVPLNCVSFLVCEVALFFLFYSWCHSPKADFHSLYSYCHLCLFFAAKPSRLPKSHPVSPAVGSSAWLQSSPPLALGLSPTQTWRERKVWHGLQPLVHEHFILGFI